jgi:hypothetical protein
VSARARLGMLHDRSGLDLDDLASACRDVPSTLGWSGLHWQSAFQHVYRTGADPGPDFWTVLETVIAGVEKHALSRTICVEPGPTLRAFAITTGELPAFRHLLAVALERLRKDEARAQAACDRTMDARAHQPPGSSRARVTTLNARWASAAEHRDRVRDARVLAETLLAQVR